MSPNRPRRRADQRRAAYEETLDALRRRFEQLERAVAQFTPDLDEQALTAAWDSDDPAERNRADSVLSNFEKTYMLLMDLITVSVKLARRIGAVDDESTPPVELLANAGVISRNALGAIENSAKSAIRASISTFSYPWRSFVQPSWARWRRRLSRFKASSPG